jgi:hypothetical protein
VSLATAVALVAIVVGVTGIDLPVLSLGGSGTNPDRLLPGVRATSASMLLRVGAGAPAGGELAFMAFDAGGNLVVSDAKRRSVMRFDASGHLLSEWGPLLGAFTLDEPAGVAAQGESVYVVDRGTPRVFRLDTTGHVLATINLEPLGTYGLNGMAVDPNGNVYVADTGRNRILAFAPNGSPLRPIGRAGSDLGAFTQPMMLAFAPDDGLFVADWENGRIERFSPTFEATDAWSTGFRPFGVDVDQNGRVFVPDAERRRVQAYSPRGAVLGEIGGSGSAPIEVAPRQVALPRSQQPSLYVLGGNGIQRVDLENTAPPPQGGSDSDVLSLVAIALLVAVLVLAVVSRRARRRASLASLGPTLDRPVGLNAVNGAQGQDHEAKTDEKLLIANQTEREHYAAEKDDQAKEDPEADHFQIDRSRSAVRDAARQKLPPRAT